MECGVSSLFLYLPLEMFFSLAEGLTNLSALQKIMEGILGLVYILHDNSFYRTANVVSSALCKMFTSYVVSKPM